MPAKNHKGKAQLASDTTLNDQVGMALTAYALTVAQELLSDDASSVERRRYNQRQQMARLVANDPARYTTVAQRAIAANGLLDSWYVGGSEAVTDEEVDAAVRATWDALAASSS